MISEPLEKQGETLPASYTDIQRQNATLLPPEGGGDLYRGMPAELPTKLNHETERPGQGRTRAGRRPEKATPDHRL